MKIFSPAGEESRRGQAVSVSRSAHNSPRMSPRVTPRPWDADIPACNSDKKTHSRTSTVAENTNFSSTAADICLLSFGQSSRQKPSLTRLKPFVCPKKLELVRLNDMVPIDGCSVVSEQFVEIAHSLVLERFNRFKILMSCSRKKQARKRAAKVKAPFLLPPGPNDIHLDSEPLDVSVNFISKSDVDLP